MTEPAPGTPVAETRIDVRMAELDSFGHVNHAVFLGYLEHARFEALRQAGFPARVLEEKGWGIWVVRVEVDYLSEVAGPEQLVVRTWADSFKRTSMRLAQEITRPEGGEVVARSLVTAVWVGPDRRPMRVPDVVREGLGGSGP